MQYFLLLHIPYLLCLGTNGGRMVCIKCIVLPSAACCCLTFCWSRHAVGRGCIWCCKLHTKCTRRSIAHRQTEGRSGAHVQRVQLLYGSLGPISVSTSTSGSSSTSCLFHTGSYISTRARHQSPHIVDALLARTTLLLLMVLFGCSPVSAAVAAPPPR